MNSSDCLAETGGQAILDRLQSHLVGVVERIELGADSFSFKRPVPPIHCANGGALSIQASAHHYSTPREDVGPYSHVEIGYPERLQGVVDLINEYHEGAPLKSDDDPNVQVFAFVPIEKVVMLIILNGGLSTDEHSQK